MDENLKRMYEETVHKQQALLKNQKIMIDALHEEINECQNKLSSLVRQQQVKLDSIENSYKTSLENEIHNEIKIFQQQLNDSQQEKEILQAENSRLSTEIILCRSTGNYSNENLRNEAEFKEYNDIIQVLEHETERLRKALMTCEEHKLELLKENQEWKRKFATMKEALEQQEQDRSNVQFTLDENKQKMILVQSKYCELQKELKNTTENSETLRNQKEDLQNYLGSVKVKLMEGGSKVTDTLRIAEEAIIEKDAALLRAKHAQDEALKLRNRIQDLVSETGDKTKQEVCKVKDDYNNKIRKLANDADELEDKLTERSLDLERSLLEKEKLKKELETSVNEIERCKNDKRKELLRMNNRNAELERKIASLLVEHARSNDKYKRITLQFQRSLDQSKQRIQELDNRLATNCNDRDKFKEAVEHLVLEKDHYKEQIKILKSKFHDKENHLLQMLENNCKEQEGHDASELSQDSLIKQLDENREALQQRVESLQSLHKSQLQNLEEITSNYQTKYEGLKKKYQHLSESMQLKEAEIITLEETNRILKDRHISLTNELESYQRTI